MKIAIIGAGISGVSAARVLLDRGCEVAVFEKSRGWGGRCASRRIDGHIIDHGAQYFTLRDPHFRQALSDVSASNLGMIEAPVFDASGSIVPPGSPRFYYRPGNSRLARDLGSGLDVRTGTPVEPVVDLTIEGVRYDHILSSAPLPQTLRLAGCPGGFPDPFAPCLCLILLVQGPWAGRTASAYAFSNQSEGATVAWTACENHKEGRVSGDITAIVVHASISFSRMHLEAAPDDWAGPLRAAALEIWGIPDHTVLATSPHRWRYARNVGQGGLPELPPGWSLTGDSLTESRVESAWLAGRVAAEKIIGRS